MDLPEGLRTRALTMADADPVYRLIVASETHDIGEAVLDLEDVIGHWQRPSFDLATQAVGVVAGAELVAYAEVSRGRYADASVPPPWRGRGIGTWLARWTQEEARRQGGSAVGMAVPQGSDGDRLLEHLGYDVAWTSWVLQLPDGQDISPQPLPPGYAVREFRPGEERLAYRVIEDAFNEWPDRSPSTYEDWAAGVVLRPGFERWSLRVVEDPDGQVVGAAFVTPSRGTGFVDLLAVRRDRRGLGLARALLVDCFAVARDHGHPRAELSTDSRTGALGLYERVGMRVTSTWLHRAVPV